MGSSQAGNRQTTNLHYTTMNKVFEIIGVTKEGLLACCDDGCLCLYEVLTMDYCTNLEQEDASGDNDSVIEIWRDVVSAGKTLKGFYDWYEDDVKPNMDGYFYGQDTSDNWKISEAYEALPVEKRQAIVDALNEYANKGEFTLEELDDEIITNAVAWGGTLEKYPLACKVMTDEQIANLRF